MCCARRAIPIHAGCCGFFHSPVDRTRSLVAIPGNLPDLTIPILAATSARRPFAQSACALPQEPADAGPGRLVYCHRAEAAARLPWPMPNGDAVVRPFERPSGDLLEASELYRAFRSGGTLTRLLKRPETAVLGGRRCLR